MEMEIEQKPKSRRAKWVSYIFDPENVPELFPFDLNPVSDIPIRLAVEQGYVKNKRDLAMFQLLTDWNGHPARSIVIAGKLEEGREIAVWIADDKEHKIDKKLLSRAIDIEEEKPAQTVSDDDETGLAAPQISVGDDLISLRTESGLSTSCSHPMLTLGMTVKTKPVRIPSKIQISSNRSRIAIFNKHLVFQKPNFYPVPKSKNKTIKGTNNGTLATR